MLANPNNHKGPGLPTAADSSLDIVVTPPPAHSSELTEDANHLAQLQKAVTPTPKPQTEPLPQPSKAEAEAEEGHENEPEIVTTGEVLPVLAIKNGIIALRGRGGKKYTAITKIGGINPQLMSAGEKHSQVRRLAALFNSTTNHFAFYCLSKPKSLTPYIVRLDTKRLALTKESDQSLKEQYWIMRDHLVRKQRERAVTQRDYFCTFEANTADLKSASRSLDEDEGDGAAKASIWQTATTRFRVYALGQDPDSLAAKTATNQAQQTKRGERRRVSVTQATAATSRQTMIPPGLEDTLVFKMQSFAGQLKNSGMTAIAAQDSEIERVLAEQFASKLNRAEVAELVAPNAKYNYHTPKDARNLLNRADFQEYPTYLKLGDEFITSVVATEFPRNFRFGKLFPVTRFRDIRMAVALHVSPLSIKEAETKLRGKEQVLVIVEAEAKSAVGNMDRRYKVESIKQLRSVLAAGDARIFQVCLVISVRARTRKRMRDDLKAVAQTLGDMNFEVAYPNRYQRRAWLSSLPLGYNWLAGERLIADRIMHPNMTGENVACLLPNCIADFIQPGGIIEGSNKEDGSLVIFNRWLKSATNPHTVVIATTGAGKTVTQEHEMLGEFLKNPDMEAWIIDIQNVLGNFAKQVGGVVIDLSLKGKQCLNPMDRYIVNGQPETIGERLTFLYALFTLMVKGELPQPEQTAIGRATKRLYHHFEDGEEALGVLFANYMNNPLYAPLRPYLLDYRLRDEVTGEEYGEVQPGIMTKLKVIYGLSTTEAKIPHTGMVAGGIDPKTGQFSRPICHLYAGRWYYCGEGETTNPYIEPPEIAEIPGGKSRPAAVWYSHPDWWTTLSNKFHQIVVAEGIFDALDKTAREPAIRDAIIPLKLGQPILSDLLPYLLAEGAINLASSLEKYCDEEQFGPIFNHFSNINLDSRFISWNCKDLDENTLRPIRMFQVANVLWARVRAFRKRRMFICDEFQTLVQNYGDVANFIRDLFQRGRFFRLSMTAIVQNISALLDYPQALICCQNADRTVLMQQNPFAIDRLQTRFELTDGQVEILKKASKGESLQKVGTSNWIHVQTEITPHHLAAWDTNSDTEGADEWSKDDEDYYEYGDYAEEGEI